jgi:hypothetical protein
MLVLVYLVIFYFAQLMGSEPMPSTRPIDLLE